MSNASKVQIATRKLDASKLGAVISVIATAAILATNPWTPVWYPPFTLAIGLVISWIATTIIEQIQAVAVAEVKS